MSESPQTRETQYNRLFQHVRDHGHSDLAVMHSHSWQTDPRHLVFTLSRYKFVAKMLSGRKDVLEVGCADAFASRLVKQEVGSLTVSDFDPVWVEEASKQSIPSFPIQSLLLNLLEGPAEKKYDAIYCLDVLEHIEPAREDQFLSNLTASMTEDAIGVIGTPSLESQVHASQASKEGHVNCKTGPELKSTLSKHFHAVFVFSMNDEVVHTGYSPMAHYLMAVVAHKK